MVGFAALEYRVFEGDEFELLIQKIGRFESDITVEVFLGRLFLDIITFPAGGPSSTNRTYTGQTFDDNIALQPNARLIYNLTLVNPDPQVVLFNPQTSVIVMDDDGELCVYLLDIPRQPACTYEARYYRELLYNPVMSFA